jgi:isopropylmalate/homocitrate/citramalate synthase
MEKARRDHVATIRGFSPCEFRPDKWEELRKFLYKPQPLQIDVVIDDATLREGLQMAGLICPSPRNLCKIALMLKEIGVEREEVMTFTEPDQEAIRMIQDEGLGDFIAAWCRASKEDVDLALRLDFRQIGVSHPVSYLHFEKWPRRDLEELLERVVGTVEYAQTHGLRVFVHGEDSTRADWNFEKVFINAIAEAGAEVYRVCDTVGCGLPDANAPLPKGIPAKIKRIKEETKIPYVEIHAHDDLGNAVYNTMAAIKAAVGLYDKIYVSTTFLGIGERAGLAETEKIIMNCYVHHNITKWNLKPLRKLAEFMRTSLRYHLPLNKAIVGDLAFAHETGIHLHGIGALPLTYEIIPPELVGHKRRIIIGRRSGKHGIHLKLEEILGKKVDGNDPKLLELVKRIKDMYAKGERRNPLGDEEFKSIIREVGF